LSTTDQPTEPKQPDAGPPRLEEFFRMMIESAASDLHLKPGLAPHLRIRSVVRPTVDEPLPPQEIDAMAQELLNDEQRHIFHERGSIDIAYEIEDSDRFRLNIYRQRGHTAIAVRRVTRDIPSFEDLHLPESLQTVAQEQQGLVLLSGPTGCGKSTSIACMLEYINQTRACHIVTIEDPIEYLYASKKALVSQREIGIDVTDFETALRALMREDPDVVLIGEMRDRETFQAALQASETGHLVFGTIHAATAPQTIGRILDLFPVDGRALIRQSLAFNLRAIVCQKLLPSIAESAERVPAVEILLSNPTVRQLIAENRDVELGDAIVSHEREGMQNFTTSLLNLIETEFVDPRVAYEAAPNVDELKMRLKGISASRAGLRR